MMTIPLHSKIMEILKKYDGNFPRKYQIKKYNEHIKNVCEKAKINEQYTVFYLTKTKRRKIEQDYQNGNLFLLTLVAFFFASNNYGK
jgi:hypothetical protein